jgi:hypothetical protein
MKKFNGHANWLHKLAPYKMRFNCYDDCKMQGCPGHIMKFTIAHATDSYFFEQSNLEETVCEDTIKLDPIQMGLILDFCKNAGIVLEKYE